MSDPPDEKKPGSVRGLSRIPVFFFTAVGVLSSLVTVFAYFEPRNDSSLHVRVERSQFRLPQEIGTLISDGSGGRRILSELNATCTEGNEQSSAPEAAASNTAASVEETGICRDSRQVLTAVRWLDSYSGSAGTLFEYEIENQGGTAASQIRLNSSGVSAVQVLRGDSYRALRPDPPGDYYSLPDLNPREKAFLLVWTSGGSFSPSDYWSRREVPALTFSGSSVSVDSYGNVPGFWYDLYDVYGTMPLWLAVPMLVAVSFLITGILVLFINVVDALIRGKPLSSVFKAQKNDAGEAAA